MRSVDDWPLAKILFQISGGKPRSVAVDQLVDVTVRRYPPFEGRMSQSRGSGRFLSPAERVSGADRSLKNSVGAIGWPRDGHLFTGVRSMSQVGRCDFWNLFQVPVPSRIPNYICPSAPVSPSRGRLWPGDQAAPAVCFTIVTWLILPVVICLSQRLSHACLSISNHTVKLRMAH
jgi:hypothetical protein